MTFQSTVLGTTGLLAWWALDGASLASIDDTSGNGHTAQGAGATTGATALIVGYAGTSFDMSGGYCSVAYAAGWAAGVRGGMVFMRPDTVAGYRQLLDRDNGVNRAYQLRLNNASPAKVELIWWNAAGSGPYFLTGGTTIVAGTTYDVAFMVGADGYMRLYVNGAVDAISGFTTSLYDSAQPHYMGRSGTFGGSQYFDGRMGHWMLFGGAGASTAEILAIHNASLSAPVSPPNVPTSVAASSITNTGATLTWSPPSTGGPVSSYEVRVDASISTAATSPKVFTGLTPGTTYNLQVRAVGAGGVSAWVSTFVTTTAVPPGVPTAVSATVSYYAGTLTWSPPAGGAAVTSYEVRLGGAGAGTTATSPHTFSGLTAGTAYSFQVRAVGAYGASAWVAVAVTTLTVGEGWYEATVTVGGMTWDCALGDPAGYGVRLPLTLGWQLPDGAEYFPCQAEPTRMTFSLLAANASDLLGSSAMAPGPVRGAAVSFSMWTDPTPGAAPWQTFVGIVTQADGEFTDAGAWLVTVYAADESMILDSKIIGYTTAWPQESIGDRITRIASEAGVTLSLIFYNGGFEGTLPPHDGPVSALAALRDALKDVASDNTSEPPAEYYGRYVYSYASGTNTLTIQPFERRLYAGTAMAVSGELVSRAGTWTRLPDPSAEATWVLVDGVTFGTPSGPPLVRNTALVDTSPVNGSATTRDNLGESLLPDGSTQLGGWYVDRVTHATWLAPNEMKYSPYVAGAVASLAPMRAVIPVVISPLTDAYELNGTDYLAGTLSGAQLVIAAGGRFRTVLRLRPELLPGTVLPP